MSNQYELQSKVANAIVNGASKQLALAMPVFQEPGHKIAIAASLAAVGVANMAAIMAKQVKGPAEFTPSADDILFASLMLANSCHFSHGENFQVEFSFDDVIKTMEDFERLTGRSYEPEMNTSLLEIINEQRAKAQSCFQGEMSQFGPN